MASKAIYQAIRKTVQSYLPGSRIVLFGSRARGDYYIHSDYDLLIITPLGLSSTEKIVVNTQIDRAIVNALKIPVDLLINSEEEVTGKMELPGHIVRTALREGIFI